MINHLNVSEFNRAIQFEEIPHTRDAINDLKKRDLECLFYKILGFVLCWTIVIPIASYYYIKTCKDELANEIAKTEIKKIADDLKRSLQLSLNGKIFKLDEALANQRKALDTKVNELESAQEKNENEIQKLNLERIELSTKIEKSAEKIAKQFYHHLCADKNITESERLLILKFSHQKANFPSFTNFKPCIEKLNETHTFPEFTLTPTSTHTDSIHIDTRADKSTLTLDSHRNFDHIDWSGDRTRTRLATIATKSLFNFKERTITFENSEIEKEKIS